MYEITRERIAELRNMASPKHVEEAYRLMADVSDCYEQQGINATLAVAHLLLADRKDLLS